jgi:hypothetical protein
MHYWIIFDKEQGCEAKVEIKEIKKSRNQIVKLFLSHQ